MLSSGLLQCMASSFTNGVIGIAKLGPRCHVVYLAGHPLLVVLPGKPGLHLLVFLKAVIVAFAYVARVLHCFEQRVATTDCRY